MDLPRGYRVVEITSNVGCWPFLTRGQHYINGEDRYLHGDFRCFIPKPPREAVLRFARDIADGLLEEIAQALEARAKESDTAAGALSQAESDILN